MKVMRIYGTAIKYRIPEFKLLAIDFGSDFKVLSAADLHMAHCAEISICEKTNTTTMAIIIFLLIKIFSKDTQKSNSTSNVNFIF
jgi:hypothetical protein